MIAPAHFASSGKLKHSQNPSKPKGNPDSEAHLSASRQMATHDASLIRSFLGGDEAAFAEIMARHQARMFSVAFSMLRNWTDAEEIVQDTFIRAHRGLAKFRGDSSLATWLHRITRNLASNRYWYFFRRRRHETLSLDFTFNDNKHGTFADLVATDASGPIRDVVAIEFSELVAACMERLGAAQREILTLRNSMDRSYGEIAHELGINVGTVKSRIARARETLRALLAEACPEFAETALPLAWFDTIRPGGSVHIASS